MENLLYGMMMREERREMPRKMYDIWILYHIVVVFRAHLGYL